MQQFCSLLLAIIFVTKVGHHSDEKRLMLNIVWLFTSVYVRVCMHKHIQF